MSELDWLLSYHSFSFAEYFDPAHMGFRTMRVLNEDYVAPNQGFGTHGHRDMEIITIVWSGVLGHRDSLGNGSEIRPGDVQRMTAGKGIMHSELNPSQTERVHLFQIWIHPNAKGLMPGYEQKAFDKEQWKNRLALVASQNGRDGSVSMHQDADVYISSPAAGASVVHRLAPGRAAWIQVARGEVEVLGRKLLAGDGASIEDELDITIKAAADSDLVLFDLQ